MSRRHLKRGPKLLGFLWLCAGLVNCMQVATRIGVSSGDEVMVLLWGLLLGPVMILAGFVLPAESE